MRATGDACLKHGGQALYNGAQKLHRTPLTKEKEIRNN